MVLWRTTTIAVLFLGAVQLLCVGVLGEYVGRIYEQVQARPLFVLRDAPEAVVDLSSALPADDVASLRSESHLSEQRDA